MDKQSSAKGKIQEICDLLRKETIEPAKQEAAEIVENAHMAAAEIVREAEEKTKEMVEKAQKRIQEEKKTFDASLQLACKQTIETLKGEIETKLFSPLLEEVLEKPLQDPAIIAKLIDALIEGIEKEGLDVDLAAFIAKEVSPKNVIPLLAKKAADQLQQKEVLAGDFKGGAKIVLRGRKMTLDMSLQAVKDLVGSFIRKEFRNQIFS